MSKQDPWQTLTTINAHFASQEEATKYLTSYLKFMLPEDSVVQSVNTAQQIVYDKQGRVTPDRYWSVAISLRKGMTVQERFPQPEAVTSTLGVGAGRINGTFSGSINSLPYVNGY